MGIWNDYKLPTNEARTQKSSLYINRYAVIVAAADADATTTLHRENDMGIHI